MKDKVYQWLACCFTGAAIASTILIFGIQSHDPKFIAIFDKYSLLSCVLQYSALVLAVFIMWLFIGMVSYRLTRLILNKIWK